jgi:hypothetical protein
MPPATPPAPLCPSRGRENANTVVTGSEDPGQNPRQLTTISLREAGEEYHEVNLLFMERIPFTAEPLSGSFVLGWPGPRFRDLVEIGISTGLCPSSVRYSLHFMPFVTLSARFRRVITPPTEGVLSAQSSSLCLLGSCLPLRFPVSLLRSVEYGSSFG